MNTDDFVSAFRPALSLEHLQRVVPSAFAERPYADVSSNYKFISTSQLLRALLEAGFHPVEARQTQAREELRSGFTRHMIRFQETRQSIHLYEAVPQLILINAHDATSAYQLRAGLYRPICENGMMCHMGDFGVVHVPHRGDVLENVVGAATTLMRGFGPIGEAIERMSSTLLDDEEKVTFAAAAARIRYRDGHVPVDAHRLLEARRALDKGDDVWHVYNVVQEKLMGGGLPGRSASGRTTRTRPIRAIREDVRINTALWHMALQLIRS